MKRSIRFFAKLALCSGCEFEFLQLLRMGKEVVAERLLRTSEGGGGKGRANRRNGSEQRVAGSADGNSDLL